MTEPGTDNDWSGEEYGLARAVERLTNVTHGAAKTAGWWTNLDTGEDLTATGNFSVPEKLYLIHSEISEALEGYRKSKQDEHLPQYASIEVELADAIIRIGDLAGALDLDLGGALVDKMAYNRQRADHKPEARLAAGGKAF